MPARNVVLLLAVLVASITAWLVRHRDQRGQRVNEVLAIIDAAYVDPVDGDSLVDAALDGVVATLDGHSAVVRGDDQRELEAALDQEFGGVGLELVIDERTGEITVAMPLPGGPAWEAGIQSGDRIKAIDGMETTGWPLRDAITRLRGEPGVPVTLTVMAGAGSRREAPAEPLVSDVRLIRKVVAIDSVQGDRRRADGSWDWWLEGEPGIALIRISGFGERTAGELDAALSHIVPGQPRSDGTSIPLRGIIIDLRGNPGGLVNAAVDVCDRFLDDGVIVSTRGRGHSTSVSADEPPHDVRRATPGVTAVGVPIAVLVDGLTASAAEIVAACLQDHSRATVVGERTFGKGTVQSIVPLGGGGLLKLTTSEYLRPAGTPIDRRPNAAAEASWGVWPDEGFVVTSTSGALQQLARWRRLRDTLPGFAFDDAPAGGPRAVDKVLGRALDALPPASGQDAHLGREKETAGDAHDTMPAGA